MLQYHHTCWKAFLKENAHVHAYAIDARCWTPDCGALICRFVSYNEKQEVIASRHKEAEHGADDKKQKKKGKANKAQAQKPAVAEKKKRKGKEKKSHDGDESSDEVSRFIKYLFYS